MWTKGLNNTIFVLTPFVLLNALGMDIYLPSVPELTKVFNTSQHKVQLTLSLYLLVTGIGQLFLGPLADRFGRRPILLASIVCYLFGSLLCALSTEIDYLIVSRIIEAMGACGTIMVSFAIVRDAFSPEDGASIYSYLNGFIALAPIAAPLLGGYLSHWYGWRSSFIFLAFFSAGTLLVALTAVEESLAKTSSISLPKLFNDYGTILKNQDFLIFSWCAGSALSAFFTFFSVSPIVTIEILGIAKQHFGYIFGGIAIFFMIVSFLTPPISRRWGIGRSVTTGSFFMTAGGVVMLLWHLQWGLEVAGLMIPMLVAMIGVGLMLGSAAAGALAPFQHIAGKAAAVYGAIQFCSAAVVGSLATSYEVTSCLPLAYTLILMGSLSILVCNYRAKLGQLAVHKR